MGFRKGTGFTNLNKVMTANQGNKLGSTVAGGISTQKQGVNTGIQTSKSAFETEAEKNRLDTQEAKDKREQVLGRFNEDNYKVDESKFQVSSGLQDQYNSQKQTLQTQQQQQAAARQAQLDKLKAQQDDYNKKIADLTARQKTAQYELQPINVGLAQGFQTAQVAGTGITAQEAKNLKNYQAGLTPLQQLMDIYGAGTQTELDALTGKITGLDTQFADMSAAEKKAYIQSEKDRLVAAGLPSDEEMQAFQKYQTGTYTGPRELGDYGSLLSKAMQTEQLGDLSRSGGGRQELLRRFVGGADGQYTQGQRQLDETLLGQDADGVRTAARGTRGLTGQVSAAGAQAANLAQDYTNKAAQFGQETRGQIQAVRDPLSQRIDQQVGNLTQAEQQRATNAQGIQDLLTSTDPKYAGMDKTARMGLALQAAQDAGYLTPEQAQQLVGEQGLVKRAGELGLDTNALLAERLKNVSAQGIGRAAGATSDQETRISALDKLMGKRGTDVEFGSGADNYTAGSTGFDVNSLQDYIAKTEAERMQSDSGFSQKMQASGLTPLQQILAGGGSLAQNYIDPRNMLDPLGSAQNNLNAVTNLAQGGVGLNSQARNAVLNALMKLNIGGKDIAGSDAGKQLMKAMEFSDNLQTQGIGELNKAGQTYLQGFGDLSSGKLDQALAKLTGFDTAKDVAGNVNKAASKAVTDVSKAVSTALGGGETGNWETGDFRTTDAATGKPIKLKEFANRSSQDILKQMLSDQQLAQARVSNSSSKHGSGAQKLSLLMKYYNQALAREKGTKVSDENLKTNIDYTDKDVSDFLNRLKPASYDYKDSVKNDPRASKDRQLGVMAQDLEKSKLGKEAVHQEDVGKVVDYKDLQPKMLASLAALNQRLKKLEGGGKDE